MFYKAQLKIERAKVKLRGIVEHPFRVMNHPLGYVNTRFRGLAKNTAQLKPLYCAVEFEDRAPAVIEPEGEVRPWRARTREKPGFDAD